MAPGTSQDGEEQPQVHVDIVEEDDMSKDNEEMRQESAEDAGGDERSATTTDEPVISEAVADDLESPQPAESDSQHSQSGD